MVNCRLFLVLLLVFVAQKSFTSPVSSGNSAEQDVSDEVQQLQKLHSENEKLDPTEKHSQPEPAPNTGQSTEAPAENPVSDGDQQASRSGIFRHRGITEAKKSNTWNNANQDQKDGYAKFSGVQYTPTDLAAYVFSTGDEEGVAVAVEELVREGMMGRTDAINYLQDVKQALTYMREQYEQQKKLEELKNRYIKPQVNQNMINAPQDKYVVQMDTEKRKQKTPEVVPISITTTEPPHQVATASSPSPKLSTYSANTTPRPKVESEAQAPKNDDLKRRLLDKVPAENSFYEELTLEEIIYQLAKDMFSQSILRGDQTAESTLSRLITFMETEVENKRISPRMKEKVLEIISAALVDSLRDYQEILPENQVPAMDDTNMYRRPANPNSPSQSKMGLPGVYRKLALGGQNNIHQLTSSEQKES